MKKLVFDYSKLYGAMRERGFTLDALSKQTGISMATLSMKMANGVGFSADQAVAIGRAMSLEALEPYFLIVKAQK